MLTIGTPAAAQPWAGLPAGARVRVLVPDSLRAAPFAPRTQVLIGTVVRAGADTLYLAGPGGSGPLTIARGAVLGLAVSRGASRTRSAAEQAVAGALLFAGVSLVADHGVPGTEVRAARLGAAGAAIGAAIGAARPYERWRRVGP